MGPPDLVIPDTGELGACLRRRERGQLSSHLFPFHFPWTSQGPSPLSGVHGEVLHGRPSRLCPNRCPRRTPQRGGERRRPRPTAEMRLQCARRRRPCRMASRSCQSGGARQPLDGAGQPAHGPAPRGAAWRPYLPSGRGGVHLEGGRSSTTMESTRHSLQGGRARPALASLNTRTLHPTLSCPVPQCGRRTGDGGERPLVAPQWSPRDRSLHRPDTRIRTRPLAPNARMRSQAPALMR